MKNLEKAIVITGSTRGIGFALARAFLANNCRVVISGRRKESVNAAISRLKQEKPDALISGLACDVNALRDLESLWKFAIEKYKRVDIWINNAGISNELRMVEDIPTDEIKRVIGTNLMGEIFGSQVALRGFQKQGYGALYNMEGMGAKKGRMIDGLSIYGTTKAGLRYFNDAIAQENKHEKILIGALLPGMVLTDMVTGQYEGKPEQWNRVVGIFDAISTEVNVVAEWLVEKMLSNTKNGIRFSYSKPLRIMLGMLKLSFQKK